MVVEPGAQLCTPLEVNRRKFGYRRLARKRSVRRGSGAPDADGPGACLSQPLGVGVDSLVFIHLIPRIDHKIRMVINRLNHHNHHRVLDVFCRCEGGVIICIVKEIKSVRSTIFWEGQLLEMWVCFSCYLLVDRKMEFPVTRLQISTGAIPRMPPLGFCSAIR